MLDSAVPGLRFEHGSAGIRIRGFRGGCSPSRSHKKTLDVTHIKMQWSDPKLTNIGRYRITIPRNVAGFTLSSALKA